MFDTSALRCHVTDRSQVLSFASSNKSSSWKGVMLGVAYDGLQAELKVHIGVSLGL